MYVKVNLEVIWTLQWKEKNGMTQQEHHIISLSLQTWKPIKVKPPSLHYFVYYYHCYNVCINIVLMLFMSKCAAWLGGGYLLIYGLFIEDLGLDPLVSAFFG